MVTGAATHQTADVADRVATAEAPVADTQPGRIKHNSAMARWTCHPSIELFAYQTAQGKNRPPTHLVQMSVLHSFRKTDAADVEGMMIFLATDPPRSTPVEGGWHRSCAWPHAKPAARSAAPPMVRIVGFCCSCCWSGGGDRSSTRAGTPVPALLSRRM